MSIAAWVKAKTKNGRKKEQLAAYGGKPSTDTPKSKQDKAKELRKKKS